MPYIEDKIMRARLDMIISENVDILKADGRLNYLLYSVCKRTVKPSYNQYKNFCGELRQCATEIERRLLAPYENKKIIENGDVE